jgi:hypothetical protein
MNPEYKYPKKVVIKDKHCGKCEIKKIKQNKGDDKHE